MVPPHRSLTEEPEPRKLSSNTPPLACPLSSRKPPPHPRSKLSAPWSVSLLLSFFLVYSRTTLAQSAEKPISLLFTSAALVTPLYKALSTDFYKTVDFYAARESKIGKETMAAFGVDKVPALVVLRGDKVDKYDGALFFLPAPLANRVDSLSLRTAQVRRHPRFPQTLRLRQALSSRTQGRALINPAIPIPPARAQLHPRLLHLLRSSRLLSLLSHLLSPPLSPLLPLCSPHLYLLSRSLPPSSLTSPISRFKCMYPHTPAPNRRRKGSTRGSRGRWW